MERRGETVARRPSAEVTPLRGVESEAATLGRIERDAAVALAGLEALKERLTARGGAPTGAAELRVAEALARIDDALAGAVRALYAREARGRAKGPDEPA